MSNKTKVALRLEALHHLASNDFHGKKLARGISEHEFDVIVAFIEDQGESSWDDYAMACRRMHLDNRRLRTKRWNWAEELAEMAGYLAHHGGAK